MAFAAPTCHYRAVTGTLSSAAMPEGRVVELRELALHSGRVSLGDDIREARERAQLTQPELGRLVGVSEGTISNWERGKVKAPKNRLARVWEVLQAYREPRLDRSAAPVVDDFDPDGIIANLTPEQLALLAARLPDHVVADDIAHRLRRHAGPRPSVPSRTWSEADIPPDPTATGPETGDATGGQPA